MLIWLYWVGVTVEAAATFISQGQSAQHWHSQQRQYPLHHDKPWKRRHKMVLPMHDGDPCQRIREIVEKQRGYLYGPSLLGNSSYFPTGPLGDAMVQQHQDRWYADASWLVDTVSQEAKTAAAALEKVIAVSVCRWQSRLSVH